MKFNPYKIIDFGNLYKFSNFVNPFLKLMKYCSKKTLNEHLEHRAFSAVNVRKRTIQRLKKVQKVLDSISINARIFSYHMAYYKLYFHPSSKFPYTVNLSFRNVKNIERFVSILEKVHKLIEKSDLYDNFDFRIFYSMIKGESDYCFYLNDKIHSRPLKTIRFKNFSKFLKVLEGKRISSIQRLEKLLRF